MEKDGVISELHFKAVRSSGPGGQNVNKVSSKVILTFDVSNSKILDDQAKLRIQAKLKTRLTSENILILSADDDRSQLKNKANVIKRFLEMIENALIIPKKRKRTKVPRSVIEKRIKQKRSQSEIKQNRRKPEV